MDPQSQLEDRPDVGRHMSSACDPVQRQLDPARNFKFR